MARAEGVVYAMAIVAAAALLSYRTPGGLRGTVPLFASVTLAAVIVLGLRVAVYESIVPATVSSKGAATYHLTHLELGALADVLRAGLRYEGKGLLTLLLVLALGLWRLRRSAIALPSSLPRATSSSSPWAI